MIFTQKVLVSTILYSIWGFLNVISTCVTSNFQIKVLPKYWDVFWYMLQAGSLECRLRLSLVLGCLSGLPLGSTEWNQEGRNGIGQKERSSWITGWMTLADPMGHLEWRWPFRVVLTHPMASLYTSTWKGHCMQPGGLRLPTGSTPSSWTTSPWREVWTTCLHVPPHPVSQL